MAAPNASAAPVSMAQRQAYTNDSAVACFAVSLAAGLNVSGTTIPPSLLDSSKTCCSGGERLVPASTPDNRLLTP
jgi:hypothetical protein